MTATKTVVGLATVLATMAAVLVTSPPRAEAASPPGFTREIVSRNDLTQPITMRFLPDGKGLVGEKPGRIQWLDTVSIRSEPVLWLDLTGDIESGGERGLIDFVLDPDFATNKQFYVYYSPASVQGFRVSAFTDTGDPAGRLASEQVLWTDQTSYITCCHYGGGLDIGPDGKLWLTTGDKFTGSRAQDLTHTDGKVLRFNTDGSIPDGTDGWPANPFLQPGDGIPDVIWAYGLRNPFRARWDVESGRHFIGEVGDNTSEAQEDLHVGGLDDAGTNYGWPFCEGVEPHTHWPNCDSIQHEDPIWSYPHNGENASITAGEVYRGSLYPAEYQGAYFFGDYARQWVHYLTFDANGNPTEHVFDDAANLVVNLAVAPDGMLYTTDIRGNIYRYAYEGGDSPPTVSTPTADPTPAPPGQTVTFTATVNDVDTPTLDLTWDFGDGVTETSSSAPGTVTATHAYSATGSYDATLTVADGTSTVTSTPVTVQVGTPPTATILEPTGGQLFVAAETITFAAPDPQPDETYEWTVVFTHDSHTHPVLSGVTTTTGSFTSSDSGHDYLGDTGYRVTLEVTDADGLSSTTSVDLVPDKTDVTLETLPGGLTIDVDGVPRPTPVTLDSLKGFKHDLIAHDTKCTAGTFHDFASWSHGEPAAHTFTVPLTATTLTATYTDTGVDCGPDPSEVPVTAGLVVDLGGGENLKTNGSSVTGWLDRSGNGNDLALGSGDPASGVTTPTGVAAVSFDGVDDRLERTGGLVGLPAGNADRTMFVVSRYNAGLWGGVVYGNPAQAQAFGLGVKNGGYLYVNGWAYNAPTDTPGVGQGWKVHSAVHESGTVSQFDGEQQIASRSRNFSTDPQRLVLGNDLGTNYVDTDVAAVLVYDRALTPAEHQQVASFLDQTYLGGVPGDTTPPTITLTGDADVTLNLGDPWTDPGWTATDDVDGDITGQVVVGGDTVDTATAGVYSITYDVTDAAGNAATQAVRTVTVVDPANDTTPPTITLTGGSSVTVDLGDPWTDPGWTATDDVDGDITGQVVVGGDTVDTATAGVYTITYDVTDAAGNAATQAVRTVTVRDPSSIGVPVVDGLVLDLEPDSVITSGSSVTGWSDLSGNGNDVTVASGDPSSGVTTPTGVAAVSFDGVDDRLERTGGLVGLPAGNADRTMFVVSRYDAGLWGGVVYGNPAKAEAFGLGVKNGGYLYVNGWSYNAPTDTPGVGQGWKVHSAVHDGRTVDQFDGTEQIASRRRSFSTDPQRLVLGNDLGTNYVDTDLAAVLVYDRALTPAEHQQVASFLDQTYLGGVPGDTTPPTITLTGDADVTLNLGDPWTDPGWTATDDVDGDITGQVVVGGDTVDTATAGVYTITYDVTDAAGNAADQATRTVTVVDPANDTTPPTITLTGDADVTLNLGDPWTDPGWTATDDVDGDITGQVVVGGDTVDTATAGVYSITYDVTDAAGNAATQAVRTVTVVDPANDTTPPTITLTGGSSVTVDLGDPWTDPGWTATDDVDGDITGQVVVGGDTVDTATAGVYTITYDVTDAAGNAATQAVRTVTVRDPSSIGVPVVDGLVLDLEPDSVITSGSSVTGWSDLSGNGNDVTVASGDPSSGVTTPTGVAAVSFDGVDDRLERTGGLVGLPAGNADRTMFVVSRYDAGLWGGVVYGNPAKAEAFGLGVKNGGYLYVNGWSYNAPTDTPGVGQGWKVHSAVHDGRTVDQFDGTEQIASRRRSFSTDPQRLVLGNDLGTNYVDTDLAAVLVYDRALTPAEHQQVADYLDQTYLGGAP